MNFLLGCSLSGTRLGCSDCIFNCLVLLFRSPVKGLLKVLLMRPFLFPLYIAFCYYIFFCYYISSFPADRDKFTLVFL